MVIKSLILNQPTLEKMNPSDILIELVHNFITHTTPVKDLLQDFHGGV